MSKKRIIDGTPKLRNAGLIGQGGKRVTPVNGSLAEGAIQVGRGPKNPQPSPKGPTP